MTPYAADARNMTVAEHGRACAALINAVREGDAAAARAARARLDAGRRAALGPEYVPLAPVRVMPKAAPIGAKATVKGVIVSRLSASPRSVARIANDAARRRAISDGVTAAFARGDDCEAPARPASPRDMRLAVLRALAPRDGFSGRLTRNAIAQAIGVKAGRLIYQLFDHMVCERLIRVAERPPQYAWTRYAIDREGLAWLERAQPARAPGAAS